MQALLVLLAIAALSLLASSPSLSARLPALARLSASGLLFLGVGALVGPGGMTLLSPVDLTHLRPVLAWGLGVAGVVLGLGLDPRLLRQVPLPVYAAAGAHSLAAFVAVAPLLAWPLVFRLDHSWQSALGASALLGAAACVSSGHLAVLSYRSGRLDRAQGVSVSLLAMLDDLVGLWVLILALAMGAAAHPAEGASGVVLALFLGCLCGALIAFLTHPLSDPGELSAAMMGGIALVAGAAVYLRLSSLLAGVACGATLVLIGGKGVERMVRSLSRLERPSYLVLVFLVGCHFQARDAIAWLILPAFVGLRFAGKIWGGKLARHLAQDTLQLPRRLGYALVAQGSLALCLVMDYASLVPSPLTQRIFDVVILGAVFNELLAYRVFGSVERAAA